MGASTTRSRRIGPWCSTLSCVLTMAACTAMDSGSEPAASAEGSTQELPGARPLDPTPTEQPAAEEAEAQQARAGAEIVDGWNQPAEPSRRAEGMLRGSAGAGDANRSARAAASPRPAARLPARTQDLGGLAASGGQGRLLAAAPAARPVTALPQNAVLASSFVGGSGAQARLEDLLDRGVMVGGENVRLEAFDELGRLPYAVPSEESVGLHAELERSRLLRGGESVHLQIALMARQGEAPPRPRMDVRLVFDRSGSMMGDKWTHGIAAAHQLVDRLGPADTFGLVSYSDAATLDFAPARIGDRRAAHRAIEGLVPGGGTNIESALRLATENAPRRRAMNDVLLVVLVSDGVATVGQTNPQELGGLARALFDEHGVLTTSMGLGTDFDEETMLAIAREGSGSYHFVRRAGDIGEILTDELEERAQAVAQALRLRIELGEGVVATRVYGSTVLDEQQEAAVRHTEIATDRRLAAELGITRDRQSDEDRGLRIHLPSFRRGDQHVVLMELTVPPGTGSDQIARVTLDYKDLLSRGNRTAHVDVRTQRTGDREVSIASTRRPVKRTVLAFQAGDTLRGASAALSRGDFVAAQGMLSERRRLLVAASDLFHDRALARDAELLGRYERVLASAWNGWDGGSRRTMQLAMNFYGDQRMQ